MELVQKPVALLGLQLLQKAAGGMSLEIGEHLREIGGGEDRVQVILQDDPGVDLQALVRPAVQATPG